MLINHLQEIDWTTLRIIKVNTSLIYCLTSQTSAKLMTNFLTLFTKILKLFYFDMILIKFLRFLLGCLYTANKNVNQPFTRDWLNYVKNKQCKHVVKQAVWPRKHPRNIFKQCLCTYLQSITLYNICKSIICLLTIQHFCKQFKQVAEELYHCENHSTFLQT